MTGITNYLIDHDLVKTLSCKLETVVRLLTVSVIDEMLADAP